MLAQRAEQGQPRSRRRTSALHICGFMFVDLPMRCLFQVAPTASHEYLCYLLRVLATDPAFSTSRPAQRNIYNTVVGYFTIADSLSTCYSLPQRNSLNYTA